MRPWVVVLAFWAVLRAAAGQSPALPSITDQAFIEACVRVHNELRAEVQPAASNMRYMTWDTALARTARAWANKCIFEHNVYLSQKHQCHPNFTSIGENIWVGSHQAFYVADAIKSWYNEVVWDNSYKIGCAVALCREVAGIQNAANFVCNYSPGKRGFIEVVDIGRGRISLFSCSADHGILRTRDVCWLSTDVEKLPPFPNFTDASQFFCFQNLCSILGIRRSPFHFITAWTACRGMWLHYATVDAAGIKLKPTAYLCATYIKDISKKNSSNGNVLRRPYIEGKSCSNCAKGDTCENKLCRNPERDKIIYYSRWHPPWEFRIVCDEACITLVVLRASLMFLAFVAVYFIKKHFTNMHMST